MSEPPSIPSFVCPVDRQPLRAGRGDLTCDTCGSAFPIVNGVPVLINDANSVFRVADYAQGNAYQGASGYGGSVDKTAGWRRAYRRFARKLSEAPVPGPRVDANDYILSRDQGAKILVIGSGERPYRGNVTYTDVAFAQGISCICDAHDLPYLRRA